MTRFATKLNSGTLLFWQCAQMLSNALGNILFQLEAICRLATQAKILTVIDGYPSDCNIALDVVSQWT